MAGRIRLLDDALADQIAAGEVIERPASVVKELLDNAVDAGATQVQVAVDAGGTARIVVSDDGAGMGAGDAVMSIRRHATSKLAQRQDLADIRTLGFRGEALPSIASVSRFRMTTSEEGSTVATEVRVDGGQPPTVDDAARARGTTVEVRDLFYNVPARLKFLKSQGTESGHIASVCLRTALANPSLSLTLLRDGKRAREYLRAGSFLERVQAVFPGETLVTVEESLGPASVQAALGAPERARAGAGGLHLFVNGRPIRDPSLARCIVYAYGSVLPPGRYPIGAVSLRVPAGDIDVNVHPQKQEVRFARGRPLFDQLTRVTARALGTSAWSGPTTRPRDYWSQRLAVGPRLVSEGSHDGIGVVNDDAGVPQDRSGGPKPQGPTEPAGFFGSLRVLGQVRRMLLVCEGDDGLHVIDQHAADECVRLDRLREAHRAGTMKTQRLLFPSRVSCEEAEANLVEAQASDIQALGLDCTRLGPTTLAVHSVPALLDRAPPERLLRDLMVELEGAGNSGFSAVADRALATMACHGALRAGDPVSNEEARALLLDLDRVQEVDGHCLHGRPIVHSLPLSELERRLGR